MQRVPIPAEHKEAADTAGLTCGFASRWQATLFLAMRDGACNLLNQDSRALSADSTDLRTVCGTYDCRLHGALGRRNWSMGPICLCTCVWPSASAAIACSKSRLSQHFNTLVITIRLIPACAVQVRCGREIGIQKATCSHRSHSRPVRTRYAQNWHTILHYCMTSHIFDIKLST